MKTQRRKKKMTILEVSFVSTFLFVLSSTQDDIRKPPTITISPSKSIIYRSDDSITLECKGEGIPSLAYYWKKNGITLKENSSNIVRGADGKITIQPATSVEEGFYQCFARNQYGTAVSTTAHVQRAFLGPNTRNNTDVLNKTIEDGKPFHIQADPRKSFPKTTSSWEIAEAKNTTPIITSKRIQISDNGDLYFAYALPADDTGGGFYRCSTYNPYLDVTAGGSYTQLTVIGNSSSIVPFVPSLAFSSDAQTVALIGGNVTLRCFFNGYPDPTIAWSGPRNTLPIGRYTLAQFNTELTIRNITAADEGDYNCTATNTQGRNTHTLQIRVEAMPTFTKVKDGPYDINVTEGESVKFSCNTSAKPEAKIVWFQDGDKLDAYNHPRRFVFSSDNRSLTIRDVCRDCVDRESKTDLMVIQCNASNVHGYAFASGYLNVLRRTRVIFEGERNIVVNASDERKIQFTCKATSDPSTPPIVRWYKVVNNKEALVYDDPPDIIVKDGVLNISFNTNNTRRWTDYKEEFRCIAENGYSKDMATVNITVLETMPPATGAPGRTISWWWIYLVFSVACLMALLLVVIIGVICVRRGSRNRFRRGASQEMGARRCDYVRTSDIGPFRREYPKEETS